MTAPKGPRVYTAIAAVAAELARAGIAKERVNEIDGYRFRGIDDIYNALSPLLVKHKLCILPRILERQASERRSRNGDLLLSVTVRAAFDFICARDGSVHTVEMYGEALDAGDKATNKAMSAAYKYAAMQTFCIPVAGDTDADATSHRIAPEPAPDDVPVQGWEQWTTDISEVAQACETGEALDRLQSSNRKPLRALSMANPALYAAIGTAIRDRREALAQRITAKAA